MQQTARGDRREFILINDPQMSREAYCIGGNIDQMPKSAGVVHRNRCQLRKENWLRYQQESRVH
jgi:hypothetical protein